MSARTERGVACLLLLAGAAPFWAGRFLPFLDLPQHLGLANAIGHLSDPAAGFSRYYALHRGVDPYWGYYAPMWLLTRVLPLEAASRVVFSAWAVAVPVSVGFALRSLGRDWRWAVFSLPLVWNTDLFFGFAPFLVSMPLFFAAVGLAARDAEAEGPAGRRPLLLGGAAAAVFLAHVQTYLLFLLCAAALVAVGWRGARWALSRSVPYLPSLVLFAAWFLPNFAFGPSPGSPLPHTANYRSFGSILDLGAVFEPKAAVVARLPERLFGTYGDGSGEATGIGWALLLGLALLLAGWPDRPRADGVGVRGSLRARRGEMLSLLALACYLFLPIQIAGQWYLGPRYLVFAALLAPAWLAARAAGWRVAVLLAAGALSLAADANAARKVAAFQRQVRGFDGLVERMDPGLRVLGLVFDRGERGPVRQPVLLHFAAYYQALRGGDVGFSFAGLPSVPLVYRAGAQAPHPGEWAPQDFRWSEMGPSYDYFLVHGEAVGEAASLGEHADVVAEAAGWTLWRRRDGPAPGSGPRAR